MSELLSRLNWVDIFVVILLIRISYVSSYIGVGKQILPFLLLLLILLIPLYNYNKIADFFIDNYSFTPSACRFLTFFLMTAMFFVVYYVILRLTGIFFFSNGEKTIGIEKIAGAFLGILRSLVLIGIILINILLAPIRFTETSIKHSYTGFFFINTNLKIYSTITNLFRGDKKNKISANKILADLVSKKQKYFFEPINLKEKSRFYREQYQ